MSLGSEFDWSLLNRECSDIFARVIQQWKTLVDQNQSEHRYQKFLSEHAGLFFGNNGTCLTISQLQLGTEYRPDLVVAHDFRSGGLLYEFIELKRPEHLAFTETTQHPSQHLVGAIDQIQEWQARIQDDCTEVKQRLPASRAADRKCSFTIIIGRRTQRKELVEKRNRLAESLSGRFRVNIRSYDYLTDELAERVFAHSNPIHLSGSALRLNQMANPFVKAFTDRRWRNLINDIQHRSSDGLALFDSHFLTSAQDEVVRHLRHSPLFEEFVARHRPQRSSA
jgi:hypothetical protein